MSPWFSQDWTLSGQTLTPMPPTCLCEPDGGLTPFSSPLPGPHVPWGPGSDGHGPFQTTVEIFCLGQTRIRPGQAFPVICKGQGVCEWGEEWALHFYNRPALGFHLRGGGAVALVGFQAVGGGSQPRLPGPSQDRAPARRQVSSAVWGDSRWTFPADSAHTHCVTQDGSRPLTPSPPLPQNLSRTSLLGFTGNFLRSISASKGPSLLNPAPKRRTEDAEVFRPSRCLWLLVCPRAGVRQELGAEKLRAPSRAG